MADIGMGIFAVSQGLSTFTAFLPKITDVRKASKDDINFVADMRTAELASAIITIGVATIASSLAKSKVPLMTGIFMALIIIVLYESILYKDPVIMPTTKRISLIRSEQ